MRQSESRTEAVAAEQPESTEPVETTTVTGVYQRAFQAHASISPSAAIAQFDGTNLTVWSHAHGMFPLRAGIHNVRTLEF